MRFLVQAASGYGQTPSRAPLPTSGPSGLSSLSSAKIPMLNGLAEREALLAVMVGMSSALYF